MKSSIESLRKVISETMETFTRRLSILRPKVAFHARVALGGAKLLLERDFTRPWMNIEDTVLKVK